MSHTALRRVVIRLCTMPAWSTGSGAIRRRSPTSI
jgi:hypothetical protein